MQSDYCKASMVARRKAQERYDLLAVSRKGTSAMRMVMHATLTPMDVRQFYCEDPVFQVL